MLFFNEIIEGLVLSDSNLYSSNDSIPMSSFNSPSVALMNALRTPQLEVSETFSSDDYNEFQSRAHSGYSESGRINNNFRIEGDN